MEVLVNRFGRQVSRPLIVVLILMLLVGAISILQKNNRAASMQPLAAPVPAPQAPAPSPAAAAPAIEPAAVPAALVLPEVIEPTTRPESSDAHEQIGPVIPTGPLIPAGPDQDAVLVSQKLSGATTIPSESVIAQAKSKIDTGRLLEARDQLNQALQSGGLDEPQATATRAMLSQISQTVVFGRQHFGDDAYGGTYVVQPGDNLAKIANAHDCTWELLSRINGIEPKSLRAGATIKVVEGPFFGVIDKQKFTMDIYLGGLPGEASSLYVTTYPVGLGKDDSTPVGTWMIEPHKKLKHPTYYSPRGEGVIAADDPKNPLGGYWIGLTGTEGQALGKLSYGIHGTIDPDSIGKQSSMGCIRLRSDDIAMVYDLMVEGKSMVVVKN
jgi:lipoprotein-anchoring transpeptidase ErfK/SrfK